jgi:hypothetical protein
MFRFTRHWRVSALSVASTFLVVILLFSFSSAHGQGLVAQSPSALSVVLTWTAPGDDGNSGTAAQYDIRYSTSTITDLNWDAATQVTGEPDPQVAGSSESFEVTGLDPNTTYYFAIKVADEVDNWSGLSNVASVTTADTEPPAAVADLGATPE